MSATIRLVKIRALLSVFILGTSVLSLGACHSDGLYDPCPLSNSIMDACAQVPGEGAQCTSDEECDAGLSCVEGQCADGSAYTCVVAEHPFCLEQICASWQGAEAVCTRPCVIDDDCPGTDQCKSHNNLRFCVAAETLVEWSPFDQTPLLNDGEACGFGVPCNGSSECCPEGSDQAGICAPIGSCGVLSE